MTAAIPSDTFKQYNADKLDVIDGLVHLLPNGWAEYGPSFSAADIVLRDKMPLDEFKRCVRGASRAALKANDSALVAELSNLETPIADKQFIRSMLRGPADSGAALQAKNVLVFRQKPTGHANV